MADQPIDDIDIESALEALGNLPAEVAEDMSSVDFGQAAVPVDSFEWDGDVGAMVPVYPEDDLMPAKSSGHFSENLAETMDQDILDTMADELTERIEEDEESRRPWTDRFREGMEMMGLIDDEVEDGPFPGSSTAVMPIISEAVTQFWSRALGEQVPSAGPVKAAILGKPNEMQLDRAERVADYMNNEIMYIDKSWYTDHSRMLFALPYSGTCFKKVYRDIDTGCNTSVFVHSEDFITNYQFTDLASAPRYTHRIWKTRNELKRAQVAGIYLDRDLARTTSGEDELPEITDLRYEISDFDADVSDFDDTRLEIYEVYCEWDLGEDPDGIALPYIITIEDDSEQILSIYRDWKEDDPMKRRRVNFVKYDYLPGPGFYGLGLLHLIGGLQQAATGSLRAIIDGAATSSLQGGFITKDASIRDQELTIEPGVWQQVDASAEDLSKAFFTPPFNSPSPVLFQIMGFLTERAEKFSATTELMTGGQNSKNAPVGSTLALIEQGGKVFSAIHRGLHKSLSDELRQRFDLIQEYMPVEGGYPYDVEGMHEGIFPSDFAPGVSIVPVSDPNIFSQEQRVAINQAVYQLSQENPDLIKRDVALKRTLIGMKVPDYEELLMENNPPEPMDPVSEIQAILRGEPVQAYPDQLHEAYVKHYKAFMDNPEFGGNPMIAQQIMGPAVALLGQRLAYLWATHARGLGVPAPMLPPPNGGDEGGMPPGGPQGMPQGPQGMMGPPPQPQADPAQIAMMAAQVAPQMAQVPGLPSEAAGQQAEAMQMQAQAEQAKMATEQAKAQTEQVKAQLMMQDSQFKGQEMQMKQAQMGEEIRIKREESAQAAALKEAEINLKQSEIELKQAIEIEKLKREKEAEDLKIAQDVLKGQQDEERHQQSLQVERARLAVEEDKANVAAAQAVADSELKYKQAEAAAKDKKDSEKRVSDDSGRTSAMIDGLTKALNQPRKIIRDSSGKATGVAPAGSSSSSSSSNSKSKARPKQKP